MHVSVAKRGWVAAQEIPTSSKGLNPEVEDTSGEQGGHGAGALVQERCTPGVLAGW